MHLLFIDENFSLPVARKLRELGHDVVTLNDLGLNNQGVSDPEVVRLATDLNRAVVTFNRKHFIQAHRNNPDHAGIIICTEDRRVEVLAQNIHEAVVPYESLHGKLIRVYRTPG